jgi:hypothetical protein
MKGQILIEGKGKGGKERNQQNIDCPSLIGVLILFAKKMGPETKDKNGAKEVKYPECERGWINPLLDMANLTK